MGAIILQDTKEAQENVAKAVLTRLDNIPSNVYIQGVNEYYKEKNIGNNGSAEERMDFQDKMLGWNVFGEVSKFQLEHFNTVLTRQGMSEQPAKQLEEERESVFVQAILGIGAQENFKLIASNDEDFFKNIIPVLEATADERNAIVDNIESQMAEIASSQQN